MVGCFFYNGKISEYLHLDDSELNHIKSRKGRENDKVEIVNGKGELFIGKIHLINNKPIIKLLSLTPARTTKVHNYHLCIAPTKNIKRTEWLVEKCTEIGVNSINFFYSQHSERRNINLDRLKKKSIEAVKQSKQLHLPNFRILGNFDNAISHTSDFNNIIPNVVELNTPHIIDTLELKKNNYIWIGSEGGFSSSEVKLAKKHQFISCTLGPTRLRTETAGIIAISYANVVYNKSIFRNR